MIMEATLFQKTILAMATASLLGTGGLIMSNTKDLVKHDIRIQHVEQVSAKLDALTDKLAVTNANIAALNAHLEDIRREPRN